MSEKVVILVTCGSFGEAKRIARDLVERRLAACVNLFDAPVRSTYRWKGEVESSAEYLLTIKTSIGLFRRVRKRVEKLHSYDVPEIIALPILRGSRAYLAWLGANIQSSPPAARRKRRARKQNRGGKR